MTEALLPNRIVITGIGVACLNTIDTKALWQRLLDRDHGLKEDAHFDTAPFRCRRNTITDTATIEAELLRRRPDLSGVLADKPPRALVHGLTAATEALTMAGLPISAADMVTERPRIGLSIGTTSGSEFDRFCAAAEEGSDSSINPAMAAPHAVARSLAMTLGLDEPVSQISNACTSSAAAIIHGIGMLISGRVDAVLTGGVDQVRPADFAGFNALRAMSPRACRAFDRDRDGMIIGDGAALLLLESETAARKRGAPILAILDGYGLTSDAFHATKPRPEGLQRAIQQCLAMSDQPRERIGYVNCHGTGTPINDVIEAQAIASVFDDQTTVPVISSTKTVTGHLLGTAAALEAVITILILRHGLVPQMAHSEIPDPAITLPLALGRSVAIQKRSALSTTLGFGGSNACLMFSLSESLKGGA